MEAGRGFFSKVKLFWAFLLLLLFYLRRVSVASAKAALEMAAAGLWASGVCRWEPVPEISHAAAALSRQHHPGATCKNKKS